MIAEPLADSGYDSLERKLLMIAWPMRGITGGGMNQQVLLTNLGRAPFRIINFSYPIGCSEPFYTIKCTTVQKMRDKYQLNEQ